MQLTAGKGPALKDAPPLPSLTSNCSWGGIAGGTTTTTTGGWEGNANDDELGRLQPPELEVYFELSELTPP